MRFAAIWLALLVGLVAIACGGDASPRTASSQFVGTTRSDKYHRPTCRWAKKIDSANEVWFDSAEAARAKGYVPCKVCRPLR